MKQIRALIALVAIALFLVAGVVPAVAQVDGIQRIEFKSPGAGQDIDGVREIAVEIESNVGGGLSGVASVTIKIKTNSGTTLSTYPTHRYDDGFAGASTAPIVLTVKEAWDTNIITPLNGQYDIFAEVTGTKVAGAGVNDETAKLENIKVNNAPAAPAGISAGYSDTNSDDYYQSGEKVNVSWSAANNAPDHRGFRLLRSKNGGPYSQVLKGNSTSHADGDIGPGDSVKYQVSAYRYSPVNADNQIFSGSVSSSTVAVPNPPPPPPPPPGTNTGLGGTNPKASGGDPLKTLSSGGSGTAPLAPIGVSQPPEPLGRTGGFGFNRRLPFSDRLPQTEIEETTETGGGLGQMLTSPGKLISDEISQNPVRFMAAGVLLLVTSGHLARAAKMLLPSPAGPTGGASAPLSLGPLASLGKKTKVKPFSRWIARS